MIGELGKQLDDRDFEITELYELLPEKDRRIAQLEIDLVWARAERRQQVSTMPNSATVIRPNGEAAEIMHAVSRASQEIVPPELYGHPDYAGWGKLVTARVPSLSTLELYWLIADNQAHLDAYEAAYPGAGVGLEDRINARIAELEERAEGSTK